MKAFRKVVKGYKVYFRKTFLPFTAWIGEIRDPKVVRADVCRHSGGLDSVNEIRPT